jgi:cytochrome c oxidase cbb3-type subunit 3
MTTVTWNAAKKKMTRAGSLLLLILLISPFLHAETNRPPSSMSNPVVIAMVLVIGFLALAIALLAHVVIGAAEVKMEAEKKPSPKDLSAVAMILFFMVLSTPLMAQGPSGVSPGTPNIIQGVSNMAVYAMLAVIFIEMIVVLILVFNLRSLLDLRRKKTKEVKAVVIAEPSKPRLSLWDRLNKFRPAEQETTIDLGHNYDGIRELDNRLPPWWLYGFYASILFACIYLWRYHVAHSAPLSREEYQIAVQKADQDRQAMLKKTANNIDESNAVQLKDPSDLAAGKAVFESTCFACHGKQGEGIVGPNLTDEYWLHGGGIKDIFKTIKYGYPEKGMKSWKDDFSPKQIEQIASYIKSLKDTHPANPKAPQGVIYKEEESERPAPGPDSTSKPVEVADARAVSKTENGNE